MGKVNLSKKLLINLVFGLLFLLLLLYFILTITSGASGDRNVPAEITTNATDGNNNTAEPQFMNNTSEPQPIEEEKDEVTDEIVEALYLENYPSYEEWEKKTSSTRPVRYEKNGDYYTYTTPTTPNTARIMCAGDLMCEPGVARPVFLNDKFFFESCFAKVRKVFDAADFAVANLETCVDPDSPYALDIHHLSDRYHCNAPTEFLEALRFAGLDAVVMGNNHSCDTGPIGLNHTIKNVESYGLIHTGTFNSPDDKRYFIVDINGIRVAFFSYAQDYNSHLDGRFFTAEGKEVMLNEYSRDRLETDLKNAREDGAEFTIVYIHFWCQDYPEEVQEIQIETAKEIAEAGADCIIGGHPHLVQPYDEIFLPSGKRVPVVYSLGNFITSDKAITRMNYIYELFLEKDENGTVHIADEKVIPCKVVKLEGESGFVVFPTPKNWRDGTDDESLQEAEEEIMLRVGDKIRIDTNDSYYSLIKS